MPGDVKDDTERLLSYFRKFDGVVVAFSGGVDSSVLAKAAYDALGERALAVTVDSPTIEKSELEAAGIIAKNIGIKHLVVKHDELANPCFRSNKPDRCYHCKKEMLAVLKKVACEKGVKAVAEGTNAEEIKGHRPGYKAVKDAGVYSPLAELGFAKKDIREIAAYLKLPNAEKPSMACLASRIPYGTELTKEVLEKVSKTEAVVRSAGVRQLRVRCFGDIAVIEVYLEDYAKVLENRTMISRELKALGFKRAVLDLDGYVAGSMSP